MEFDVVVIGAGPGGYVAAIRAAQLKLKTAIVEKENLGGVCLNWGCIPTKALLKSAQVFQYIQHADSFGISLDHPKADFSKMIQRSRGVAQGMSKGIQFLMKKNKIEVFKGTAKANASKEVIVSNNGESQTLHAKNIIFATGAQSRSLPNIPQDGKNIIGYREALSLKTQPKSMVIIGSGAIGSEFAYFYNAIGTQVTLVEYLPEIVPLEDAEVSQQLQREFKKQGIEVLTKSSVEKVDIKNGVCHVSIKTEKGETIKEVDTVLSAVGIKTNLTGIGLEEIGVSTEKGKVIVDENCQTTVKGCYAIGDIIHGPSLAHVASAEGIIAAEHISGLNPESLNYENIPACTYTSPEIASVGITEKEAKEKGIEIKIGKFPFSASGKASAAGHKEGFVKVIFDAKYGEWLGCHMIGSNVTEMIAEAITARKLETTGHEILKSVHPHPTMSEAIMEATAAAYGEVIHI